MTYQTPTAKSPVINDTPATTKRPKMPLFEGGENGNALGQVIFTYDEWQALTNAIDRNAPLDHAGVYEIIKDRILDETETGSYTLNLHCYDDDTRQIYIDILEFITRAVNSTDNESLKAKIENCINEQIGYFVQLITNGKVKILEVEFDSEVSNGRLADSLKVFLAISNLFIKGE